MPVTVSAGVTTWTGEIQDIHALVRIAHDCLVRARRTGPNRTMAGLLGVRPVD